MSYRIKRTDSNQKSIVEAIRSFGATVFILSDVGNGFPDLVVGYYGYNFLWELKDGTKPQSARKLTKNEQKFFDTWLGSVCIICSEKEAIDFLIAVRKLHVGQ